MSRLTTLGRRLVIAHRGASRELPENTVAAFARALELGADALELDVRLSRDGVPIVVHDDTVDRTTGSRGPVGAREARELARLGIPALAEVLDAFPAAELLIEIKEAASQRAVAETIQRAAAAHRCVVAAAGDSALTLFRGGRIPVCGSRSDVAALRWRAALGIGFDGSRYAVLSVPVRSWGIPIATEGFFRTASAAGIPVHVWTIDAPGEAISLWERGATGIVTNDPAEIVAVRDSG